MSKNNWFGKVPETTTTEEKSLVPQDAQLDAEKQVDARSQPTQVAADAAVEEVDARSDAMHNVASGLPATLPTIKSEALEPAMPVVPDDVVIDSKAAKAMTHPERVSERDKFVAAARAFFLKNDNEVTEVMLHSAFDEAHLMSLQSSGHIVPVSMVKRTYRWIDADPVAAPQVTDEGKGASEPAPGPLDSNDAAG